MSRYCPISSKPAVRHAELLALVDVGRAAVQVQHRRQRLGRGDAVLGAVVAEPRHRPRLVVVVPVERVPPDVGQAALPRREVALQHRQGRGPAASHLPPPGLLVEVDVLEGEDHVELVAGRVGDLAGQLDRAAGHLADGQQVLRRRARPRGSSRRGTRAAAGRWPRTARSRRTSCPGCTRAVRQRRVLGDQVDDVHPEAVDAAVDPPAHHRVDRLADLGVLPVQVGLLRAEDVQVVLAAAARRTARRSRRTPTPSCSARPPRCRPRSPRAAAATSTSRASATRGRATPGTRCARRRCG